MSSKTVSMTEWCWLPGLILWFGYGLGCNGQQTLLLPTATVIVTGDQEANWSYDGEQHHVQCRAEPGRLTISVSATELVAEDSFRFVHLGWQGVPLDDHWPSGVSPIDGLFDFLNVWVGPKHYMWVVNLENDDGETVTTSCSFFSIVVPSTSGKDWLEATIRCTDVLETGTSQDPEPGSDPVHDWPRIAFEAQVACEIESF